MVVLDVGGRDDPFTEDLLSNIDYISPNETELERIIGPALSELADPIEDIIRTKLLSKYPSLKVLLKLGADGCAIVTKDLHLKCHNITKYNDVILQDYTIVDVTGAGLIFSIDIFLKRYRRLFDGIFLCEICAINWNIAY